MFANVNAGVTPTRGGGGAKRSSSHLEDDFHFPPLPSLLPGSTPSPSLIRHQDLSEIRNIFFKAVTGEIRYLNTHRSEKESPEQTWTLFSIICVVQSAGPQKIHQAFVKYLHTYHVSIPKLQQGHVSTATEVAPSQAQLGITSRRGFV